MWIAIMVTRAPAASHVEKGNAATGFTRAKIENRALARGRSVSPYFARRSIARNIRARRYPGSGANDSGCSAVVVTPAFSYSARRARHWSTLPNT